VTEMEPGNHPLDELATALARLASGRFDDLGEQLQRDERGLVRAAQLLLPNDGSQLVLAVDQFEEVLTAVGMRRFACGTWQAASRCVCSPAIMDQSTELLSSPMANSLYLVAVTNRPGCAT
jgi:hypothetical protein